MVELLLSEADGSQSRRDRARSIELIDEVYRLLDAEEVAEERDGLPLLGDPGEILVERVG